MMGKRKDRKARIQLDPPNGPWANVNFETSAGPALPLRKLDIGTREGQAALKSMLRDAEAVLDQAEGKLTGEISEALLDDLRWLGDEYGPLGVALAAAELTSKEVLIATLQGYLLATMPTQEQDDPDEDGGPAGPPPGWPMPIDHLPREVGLNDLGWPAVPIFGDVPANITLIADLWDTFLAHLEDRVSPADVRALLALMDVAEAS